ncbi:MAG: methyltransferase domain-containing protein [Euryarchaeota archaeon]|nr:methyltransferase domain-containing protein [Euryarchaeota archaeon]
MAKTAKRSGKGRSRSGEEGVNEEKVRAAVRERYGALALTPSSCCGSKPETMCSCGDLYPKADIVSLPSEAIAVSAGCGNPTAIADLKPGMTVVDLGSGGGIDCFLSAKKVGFKGRVYGIDATPEMIHRARITAKEMKAGGKLAVSDMVLMKDLPESVRKDLRAWSECVSGAVSEKEYTGAMRTAGFENIKVEERVVYTKEQLTDYLKGTDSGEASRVAGIDLSDMVASYKISAKKPKK